MRVVHGLFLTLAALVASAAGAQPLPDINFDLAQVRPASDRPRPAPPEEIIVIGQRERSLLLLDVVPEIELGPEDIAGFAAGTIGELIGQLSPQTAGAGRPHARPLVLINGQRTLGLDEVRTLPPEAIRRIEILPEHVALRYGMRPGMKVVNLVLQPRFRATTAETSYGGATGGGRSIAQARVNVAGIAPGGRWSLDAAHVRETPLTEDERPLTGGSGRFRTLLPRTLRTSLGGSFATNLSAATGVSLTARLEQQDSESRIAPPFSWGFVKGLDELQTLTRNSSTRSATFGANLNGVLGVWNWSATGNYRRASQEIATRHPAAAPTSLDLIRSATRSADVELFATGDLVRLPAGPLMVTMGGRLETVTYRNRWSAVLETDWGNLARRSAKASINIEAPILDGSTKGLEALGGLWANLNVDLEHVSGFGSLKTIGAGLRWTPARWVSADLSLSRRESAPDIHSLGEPVIYHPNVRTFDFTTGATVDILRVEGGNRGLLEEEQSAIALTLSLRPFPARNLVATVNYARDRVSAPVRPLSIAMPEFELAFPERFERSPDGRLVRIDARAVNFAQAEKDELRWGFSFFKRLSDPPRRQRIDDESGADPAGADAARATGLDLRAIRQAPANPGTLQLALYHTWMFRDRLLIRPGMPYVDFLRGAPSGLGGGTPAHRIEAQAAYYRSGIGLRLTGSWRSATTVRAEEQTLSYSSIARFDLRLFADLGERRRLVERVPWLRRTRISVEVDNLSDARPRVRDQHGRTPPGLQAAYLDPLGRTVRISVRKLF